MWNPLPKLFSKNQQKILNEAALLAASLPNPNIYRVDRPGPIMKKRQAWIIRQVSVLGGQQYLDRLE